MDNGAVVVAASFGDIAGDFILDAAAPKSLLHLTRAQSDGIDAPSASRPFVLAGEHIANLEMTVSDLDARSRAFDTTINGVIGDDVLRRFVVEIAFSPCRITLYRHRPAPMAETSTLRVSEAAGIPAIHASISDGTQSRAGLFAIDTARSASQIAGAALSRSAPESGPKPPVRLRALAVAGRLFEQTPAGVSLAAPGALQGSIGTAVWSHWRLRLDLRDRWLQLGSCLPHLEGEERLSGPRLARRHGSSHRAGQ